MSNHGLNHKTSNREIHKVPKNSSHTLLLSLYATIERCFRSETDHTYWTTELTINTFPSSTKTLRGRGKIPVQIGSHYLITGQLILDPGKEWEHVYLLIHVAEKIPMIVESMELKVVFDLTALVLKVNEEREGKKVDVFYTVRDEFEKVGFRQTMSLGWGGEGVKVGGVYLFRGAVKVPEEKDWVVEKVLVPRVS